MGLNIIITGGAGYVGTSVCDALQARDDVDRIVVYDQLIRNDRRFFFGEAGTARLNKVEFIQGDILDTRRLSAACDGMDCVIHLAAFVDEPFHYSQHVQYDQVNAYGTLSVVRALEANDSVRSVVHLSSSAVYGFREGIEVADDPHPDNGYAHSKRKGELYLAGLMEERGIPVSVMRSAHIFGYNRACRFDTLVHSMLFSALTGGTIPIFGSGAQIRPFVSLDKIVEALVGAVGNPKTESALLADFQCDLNALLGWIRARLPEIEYRYLTPAVEHPSQSFAHLGGVDAHQLDAALEDFRARLLL